MPIFNMPLMSAFGNNVKPFDGAKMFIYEAGTTTDKTSYTTNAESVAHTNPVVADADGRFAAIYLSGTFKAVLKDKNDVTIWTEDNLQGKGGQFVYLNTTDFDSTTNAGDYPAVGGLGDTYRVGSGFTLNAASGGHILKTGDFITCNKAAASAIDADWDITRGKIQNVGTKALVDGANIPTDCSEATVFTVTLGDNRTLDNPTNKNVGQIYTWKITQDGTGGRTLAFGTDFDFNATNLIDGTIAATTLIKGVCVSSTSIQCELENKFASKAEAEAGTATNVLMTPDSTSDHVASAKAWVSFNGNGSVAIRDSYNVTSITDNGTGDYDVNFTTVFSSTGYAGAGFAAQGTTSIVLFMDKDPTAGVANISGYRPLTEVREDSDFVTAMYFGDQ